MNVQRLHRRVLVECLREPSGPCGCRSTTTKKIPHNQNSTGRTSPNAQTQHKAKFDVLFCKEWELQCECVGKLMNHCWAAKRQQRQGETQRDTIRRLAPLLDTTQYKTRRDLGKGGKLRFCIQILPVQWNFQWLEPVGSLLTSFFLFSLDVAERGKWAMTQGGSFSV